MLKAVLNISILTFSQHADVHSILICVGEGCPYQCLGLPCGLITFKHARAKYGMIDPEEPLHLVGISPPPTKPFQARLPYQHRNKVASGQPQSTTVGCDRGYFA